MRDWQKLAVRNLYRPTLLEELDRNIAEPAIAGNTPTPTAAPPGSPRKMFAIRMRLRRRQLLWDPDDEKCFDADSRTADVAFAARQRHTEGLGFWDLLAAARASRRQMHAINRKKVYTGRVPMDVVDESEACGPGWLAKELAAWRAKEDRRTAARIAELTFPASALARRDLSAAALAG